MSEFSVSYHIRLGEGIDAQKLLRQAKAAGIVFGPANGWLTFVPYAGLAAYRSAGEARFADYLATLIGLPVLYYCHAEDCGWSFALAGNERPLVQFACWWDPQPAVELDQFDPFALAPFVATEALEPLLRPFDAEEAMLVRPADRFGELLGLPAYQWLSPDLAQDRTQDLLDRAGRKLGAKPASAAVRFQLPPNRRITFPDPAPTAREALKLIAPFMAQFKPPWSLTMVTTWGFEVPEGRGVWKVWWRYGDSGDTVTAVLANDGRVLFSADSVPSYATDRMAKAIHLPEKWLDSPHVTAIMAELPIPDGFDGGRIGSMALKSLNDCLHWEIVVAGNRGQVGSSSFWTVYVDAVSGEVLAEVHTRKVGFQETVRQRVRKGDWTDVDTSSQSTA
ncbi:MAG: PepSY domain-containing protein [Bradyrhizobium sp.]|uniref:PepSY domain-containing protein n=1 Tax=Bradyrhizobium sp. TaxID=376 RepID=UPI0029B1F297|nr:PepSY domain-containing protein [Bradyrhizobium sp.]MDX3971732.1 PepSY domain-containing protein [Bradyrhizobium sp.]